MRTNKKIILTAILLAMLIVLSRFLSIKTPITKISFAFVPTMLCAIWLGPKWTILLNVLGDVIGATLFPSGAFFIGYTISTAVSAAIYGFILYKKEFKRKVGFFLIIYEEKRKSQLLKFPFIIMIKLYLLNLIRL